MLDNRTASAIDLAFKRKPLPVYVVSRHGYVKRCFSRDTALQHLAKFMTTKVFWCAGLSIQASAVQSVSIPAPNVSHSLTTLRDSPSRSMDGTLVSNWH